MLTTVLLMAILGAIAGSFAGALAWRLHQKLGFVMARSQCPACGHKLVPLDLIPLLSYLWLRGKCRYCHTKIAGSYLGVEVLGAIWFAGSYWWWPAALVGTGQLVLFGSWLLVSVFLLALLVSDQRFMILPSKLIYPAFAVAASGRLYFILTTSPNKSSAIWHWIFSVAVASGIFYALFEISRGKWIGFGDVRLGLISGTVLADPAESLLMLFLASLMGTAALLPMVAFGKRKINSRIAYGPWLILSTLVVVLFGSNIITWYKNLFS